jgi:hypothetical protein
MSAFGNHRIVTNLDISATEVLRQNHIAGGQSGSEAGRFGSELRSLFFRRRLSPRTILMLIEVAVRRANDRDGMRFGRTLGRPEAGPGSPTEGKRYPLASPLLIAIAAMLAGRRDQLGIVRWGRRLSREALAAIGIARQRVPAPSVWCELFQHLDVAALGHALGAWLRGGASMGSVAINGKRLRAVPPRRRQACVC